MSILEVDKSIKPDPKCSVCKGLGKMKFKKKETVCECILRKQAKNYLGPLYANVPYSTVIKFDVWKNIFLCFDMCSKECFRSIVKSYLLYKNMKVTHKHIMPNNIIECYFEDSFNKLLRDVSEIDFLTIFFISDPSNRLYGELIEMILDRRMLYNKITWLFFKDNYEETWFSGRYSNSLQKYLLDNFERPKKVNVITFKRGLPDE
jgi:hypothetical protein